MTRDLPPGEIYNAIVGDFESGWNALAASPVTTARSRGNFMFARQGMVLLEFAARLGSSGRGAAWTDALAAQLNRLEPLYFARLPGPVTDNDEFTLPSIGPDPSHQLLWAIFDLVRNGGAHQYQQITANLQNRRAFALSILGVPYGERLGSVRRHDYHLWLSRTRRGDLWLTFCPDTFFLDVKEAIEKSGLLTAGLKFQYLSRPRPPRGRSLRVLPPKTPLWYFDTKALRSSLVSAGLHEVRQG